jgi:hypothetical protein
MHTLLTDTLLTDGIAPRTGGDDRLRTLTIRLADRVDGVNRVVTLLRSRRYDVRRLVAEVAGPHTLIRCTVRTTEAELLLARLDRLPTVLAAALD